MNDSERIDQINEQKKKLFAYVDDIISNGEFSYENKSFLYKTVHRVVESYEEWYNQRRLNRNRNKWRNRDQT